MRSIENAIGAMAVYALTTAVGAQYSSDERVLPSYVSDSISYDSRLSLPPSPSEDRMVAAEVVGLAALGGLILVGPTAFKAARKRFRTTFSRS